MDSWITIEQITEYVQRKGISKAYAPELKAAILAERVAPVTSPVALTWDLALRTKRLPEYFDNIGADKETVERTLRLLGRQYQ